MLQWPAPSSPTASAAPCAMSPRRWIFHLTSSTRWPMPPTAADWRRRGESCGEGRRKEKKGNEAKKGEETMTVLPVGPKLTIRHPPLATRQFPFSVPSPQPPAPTPYPPPPTPHSTGAPGNCCCICARRSWGCRVIWASTTADSWSAGGRWLRSCRWNRPAWRRARWCSGTRSRWRMPVSSRSTCWGCGCCRCWKKRRDGWEKREMREGERERRGKGALSWIGWGLMIRRSMR